MILDKGKDVKNYCKVNYNFNFEKEFKKWRCISGGKQKFDCLVSKNNSSERLLTIGEWKNYIVDKYKDMDEEFIERLKIIKSVTKSENSFLNAIGISAISITISTIMGVIVGKTNEVSFDNGKQLILFCVLMLLVAVISIFIAVKIIFKECRDGNLRSYFIDNIIEILEKNK